MSHIFDILFGREFMIRPCSGRHRWTGRRAGRTWCWGRGPSTCWSSYQGEENNFFQPKFGKWWGGRVSHRKKEDWSDGKMIACSANHWTPVVAAAASVPRSVIWPLSLLASSHLISSSFYCFIFLFNQTGSMELYFCIGWDCLCPAPKIVHCHSYFEDSKHIGSYLEDSLVLQGVKNKVLPLAGQWAEVLACLAREQFVNS